MKVSPKMKHLEISSRLLARNTLLNFIGQAVPLVAGVATGEQTSNE